MAQQARRTNNDDARALAVQPPRLPMPAEAAPEGVSPGQWKALVDAIFPSAKTVDGVMLAITYCKQRGLDIFKRPVHVVPMWNSALNREVETVWPGINDYRTTASRTGVWAGNDECKFGPTLTEAFEDQQERSKWNSGSNQREKYIAKEKCAAFSFPEWAQITVYKIVAGQRVAFIGPKVHFKEIFSGEKGLRVPNSKWRQAPIQMIEKCAEAAALRRAFPEELGNEYTAEEMEGKVYAGDPIQAAQEHFARDETKADPKPTRETSRGWSDAIQSEIDAIQQQIDNPGSTVNGLKSGREHLIAEYRSTWPDPAIQELERRFDARIVELGGESPSDQNQEEVDNDEKAD